MARGNQQQVQVVTKFKVGVLIENVQQPFDTFNILPIYGKLETSEECFIF